MAQISSTSGPNPELTHPQESRTTGRSKTDGGIAYKQNLVGAKMKTGKKAQQQRRLREVH